MGSMSTVVLARKYRPRNFAQMAGQEHVVRALGNALRQQRLHHAYLFTGTRGVGKTTVSRILAKSLNCVGADGKGSITAEPCGVCSVCRDIDQDRFIDYIEMDAASNRGIDEIRDMIERAAYKPSVGRFKVFMIDEAHQLTKEAFNALLKTLEEPPEYLKFVLATTDPDKMLPTVLSRCLQFNLRPMAPETVRAHLVSVLHQEGIAHDDGSLQVLSKAARGSMRDALSLTDQAIAYGGGSFDESLVRSMLGLADAEVAPSLLRGMAQRDGAAVLNTVQAMRERGMSFADVLEQMALLLQRMAVAQAVPDALTADDADLAVVQELATLMTPEETQLAYSLCLHGREELALMSDSGAAFSMVLLRYLSFPPVASHAPVAARTAALRATPTATLRVPVARRAEPPAAPVSAPLPIRSSVRPMSVDPARADPASPTASPIGLELDAKPTSDEDMDLSARWNTLVRQLIDGSKVSGLVRELAWQSAWVQQTPGSPQVWTLRNEHEALHAVGLRDKLASALSEAVGETVELQVVQGRPHFSPARREAQARERRQQAAEQQIQQDPVVCELLTRFKTARLVPGSIKPFDA
jgi:DNA polymerase III subunit gamma/tau